MHTNTNQKRNNAVQCLKTFIVYLLEFIQLPLSLRLKLIFTKDVLIFLKVLLNNLFVKVNSYYKKIYLNSHLSQISNIINFILYSE